MEHDANGLRILTRDECLGLLAPGGLGRIGLSHRALPVILPISFGLLDDSVVFEVPDGLLLRAARRNDVACFEADSADLRTGEAWSVMATGQLVRVDAPTTIARAAQLGLRRWLPKAHGDYLLLPATMISGRHIACEHVVLA